jgi:CRP-like cAMP-binding protein
VSNTADIVRHFLNTHETVSVPAGRVLFREGEPADVMYVLLDGMADILVGDTHVELATPGTLLGEMALLDHSKRSATVACRTPCRFITINQAEFDSLVKETPSFARHVMTLMAERLRRMNERISQGHTIELAKRGGGEWCFAVYAWDGQGNKALVEQFSTHELAVQKFPQARLTTSVNTQRHLIPST